MITSLKKLFSSPYPYIFLFSYVGVLLIWNSIKIPMHNPPGIISHLTVEGYNPTDNILRFWIAIFIPPLACLAYWWVGKNSELFNKRRPLRKILLMAVALLSLFLALAMGMVQNSSNPANNPSDPYGTHANYLVDTFHEGETLGPAISYQQKNLKPYSDFVVIHGVFQDPLRSVIAFKLFGRSIGAERTFTTLLIMLTFVAYFLLLLVLFRGSLVKSAAAIVLLAFFVLPGGIIPLIQNQFVGVQLPFRDITTIVFLACAVLAHYLITISRYKDYLDGEEFTIPNAAYSKILLALSATVALAGAWFISQFNSSKYSSKGYLARSKHLIKEAVLKYHTEILLGLTAILFMRSAIGRADVGHFIYSVQWLYLFLAYIAINYFFSYRHRLAALQTYFVVVALLFMSAFYAGQLYKLNIRRDVFPLHIKDADLVRPDYLQTANYLKQNLNSQQTFVTLTSEGVWYYLVNKPSPIKYPIIWYAFTQQERKSIADSLANNNDIKYIVTNNNWTSDFDFVPNPQRFPEVYKVLYSKYRPLTGFGQQTIWVRK
jgi:hypothetical protein